MSTTDTEVSNLIVNKLTLSKYKELKTAGTLSETEAYEITDIDTAIETGGADAANKSLSNLNSTGQAVLDDKLNTAQITNCITEIPQDIKLSLNNGTLTLLAGSKVYVPNGSGIFDVITTSSDITFTQNSALGKNFLYVNSSGTTLSRHNNVASGASVPADFTGTFYNTSTNKIQYYSSGTPTANYFSLPIAVFTIGTNQTANVTSIDQVFNGFGYIGSTVFALPGVKGLIPNGRNEDGSLKNTEFTVSNVISETRQDYGTNVRVLKLGANYISGMSKRNYRYDEINNFNYEGNDLRNYATLGDLVTTDNKINSFTMPTAFHAVDYNDFTDLKDTVDTIDSNAVHKTGDETITGQKTFTQYMKLINGDSVGGVILQNTAIQKGTAPSANQEFRFYGHDKNNLLVASRLGGLATIYKSDGSIVTTMQAFKPEASSNTRAEIYVTYPSSGNAYTHAPTPNLSSNNTNYANQIMTVGYVNNAPVTATGSTTARTLANRFSDILNVKDFGAIGDGVTNDTAAFNAAGANIYVPKGEYHIYDLNNINTIQGKGIIHCATTGQRFCADGVVMNKEEIIGYPFFGTGSNQIFTGANRTSQGFAYVKDSTGDRLFISVLVDTNEPQQARIVEFRIVNGVVQPNNVAYSNPIHIGHAQGMGVTRQNGEIYLWSMSPTDYSVSKIHWRGADTSDDDVETITLLSSSGKYKDCKVITPTVSADGKYLMGLSKGPQTTYTLLAFDMSDLTTDKVKFAFDIERSSPEVTAVQGLCADTKYIYTIEAGTYTRKSIVSKYTYSGNHCGAVNMFSGLEPQAGNVISQIEAEGICCYGNSLLTVSKIWEQAIVDVVSWGGYNYACVKSTTGNSIYNPEYWVRTTAAANKGTWNDTTSYTAGAVVSNVKAINKLGNTGTPVYNLYNKDKISYTNTGDVNVPMLRGQSFTISALTDKSTKKAFNITGTGNVYFYDLNYDATNNSSGWLSNVSNSTNQRIIYHGGDSTNTDNTGFIGLYGADDTTGYAVTMGVNNKRKIVIDKDNNIRIRTGNDNGASNRGFILSRSTADSEDRAAFFWHSTTTFHIQGQGYVAIETLKDDLTVDVGVTLRNDAMLPSVTNTLTFGVANRLWKEIFCANATINTSDERLKQDIEDIDERVFRAWEKVDFKQFRFKQAVNEKGENARIHFGLIAQQVKEAFESEGLDGFKYGLLCYDEWEDEYEDIEVTDKPAEYDEEGNVISPAEVHTEKKLVRAAGNAYGIRYGEALALECAYQRWKLEQLEKKLK